MSTMSKRRPSVDSQVVTLVATSRLRKGREYMPQYVPQLGTRIRLTGQFVANGREPLTPGAVRAPPAGDDEPDFAEPVFGEPVFEEPVFEDAAAVTPDAGLRSPGDVVAVRRGVVPARVALGPDAAGATVEWMRDVAAEAAVAGAPGSAWAAPSRSTIMDDDIAPTIMSARSPLSRIR